MKTLKLQLLAASMLTCATAFAQTPVTPATPTPSPVALTPTTRNNLGTAARTRESYQNSNSSSDSRIDQTGSQQSAFVTQTSGNGAGNTADIYQLGGFNNRATQTQSNNGPATAPAGRNIARADQLGNQSTSDQTQNGYANTANVVQRSLTDNSSAVQNQGSDASRGYQFIDQNGNNNYGYQTQTSGQFNKAEIVQTGNSNTADQRQSGMQNQASARQSGSGYSLIQQTGNQNEGFVIQK
jgi:hypothetical protein